MKFTHKFGLDLYQKLDTNILAVLSQSQQPYIVYLVPPILRHFSTYLHASLFNEDYKGFAKRLEQVLADFGEMKKAVQGKINELQGRHKLGKFMAVDKLHGRFTGGGLAWYVANYAQFQRGDIILKRKKRNLTFLFKIDQKPGTVLRMKGDWYTYNVYRFSDGRIKENNHGHVVFFPHKQQDVTSWPHADSGPAQLLTEWKERKNKTREVEAEQWIKTFSLSNALKFNPKLDKDSDTFADDYKKRMEEGNNYLDQLYFFVGSLDLLTKATAEAEAMLEFIQQ